MHIKCPFLISLYAFSAILLCACMNKENNSNEISRTNTIVTTAPDSAKTSNNESANLPVLYWRSETENGKTKYTLVLQNDSHTNWTFAKEFRLYLPGQSGEHIPFKDNISFSMKAYTLFANKSVEFQIDFEDYFDETLKGDYVIEMELHNTETINQTYLLRIQTPIQIS